MQRVNLISDCHLLYVLSIGGPAAARVVHRGVHPLKRTQACPVREELDALREVLAHRPPPWLARIIGRDRDSSSVPAGDSFLSEAGKAP